MKRLFVTLLALVVMCSAVALAACSNEEEPEHVHDFAPEWTTDEASHWHACKGEGCTEVSDKVDHAYDNACDATCNVCGATRTPAAHVYDHACDPSCNVCGAVRTIAANATGEDPIDCGAGWVGAEMINGTANGQYVFKIDAFDSQYQIVLTSDRMDWTPNANNIAREKYTLRFFDKDLNELRVNADRLPDVEFLDAEGNDITENYEGEVIYMMVTLNEAMTFCPYAN